MQEKNETQVKRDPEGVRRDILRVATRIFSEDGLSGARIDDIAAATKTSKRMIYYYFGDKEGLYQSCLEAAYASVRFGEEQLELGDLPPEKALAKLVAFTFDHHRRNPEFIRMVMIENVHKAKYLRRSEHIGQMNRPAIQMLSQILQRGQGQGVFHPDLDPLELHWLISSLSFFNVSNRPTFSAIYGEALFAEAGQDQLRQHVVDMILAFVRKPKDSI